MSDTTPRNVTELEEAAWGLLANVSEGDWTQQPQVWQDAVVRWREAYHAKLAAQPEEHDA